MGDTDEIAVRARVGMHRHDPETDLVTDDDRRSWTCRQRVVRRGDRSVEDRVDGGDVVPQEHREPQGQAVDEDRLRGLGRADGSSEVGADIDRRPACRAFRAVTADAVIELWVTGDGGGKEPGAPVAGKPAGRRESEPALAAPGPTEREDQRCRHVRKRGPR